MNCILNESTSRVLYSALALNIFTLRKIVAGCLQSLQTMSKYQICFHILCRKSLPRCVLLTLGIWFAPWRQQPQTSIIKEMWKWKWAHFSGLVRDLVASSLWALCAEPLRPKRKLCDAYPNELKYPKCPPNFYNSEFI